MSYRQEGHDARGAVAEGSTSSVVATSWREVERGALCMAPVATHVLLRVLLRNKRHISTLVIQEKRDARRGVAGGIWMQSDPGRRRGCSAGLPEQGTAMTAMSDARRTLRLFQLTLLGSFPLHSSLDVPQMSVWGPHSRMPASFRHPSCTYFSRRHPSDNLITPFLHTAGNVILDTRMASPS